MEYCKKCGEEIIEGGKFCVVCGTPTKTQQIVLQESKEHPLVSKEIQEQTGNTHPSDGKTVEYICNMTSKEKNKKKSKKKMIVALISSVVISAFVIVAILIFFMLNDTYKIDIGSFLMVEYKGYDTVGKAVVEIDDSGLIETVLKAQAKDLNEKSLYEIKLLLRELIDSFSYKISNDGSLANGDKIEIAINYDKKIAEKCELELINTTIICTVEKLEELTEMDPFQYVEMQFEGFSEIGSAVYEKNTDIEFAGELEFVLDKSNELCNGDTIVLSIEDSSIKKMAELGYKLKSTVKEYKVEGLAVYYGSFDDISVNDMGVIDKMALEKIENDYNMLKEYVKLSDVKYVGAYFAQNNQSKEKDYMIVIYKGTVASLNGDYEGEIYLPIKITNLQYGNNQSFDGIVTNMGKLFEIDESFKVMGDLSEAMFYYDNIIAERDEYSIELDGAVVNFGNITLESEDTEIYELITSYIQAAYIDVDIEKLEKYVDDTSSIDLDLLNTQRKYIESYHDIECYKMESIIENTYLVFMMYGEKFYNIETPAPSCRLFIVKYNDDGTLIIHNMPDSEAYEDYMDEPRIEMINVLVDVVEARLSEARKKDEELNGVIHIITGN